MNKEENEKAELSGIFLERYYLQELDEEDTKKVENFLNNHAIEKEKLKEIENSNEEFLKTYSITEQLKEIQIKHSLLKLKEEVSLIEGRRTKKRKLTYGFSILACIFVIAFFTPSLKRAFFDVPKNHIITEGIRVKGMEPKLILYNKKDSTIKRIFDKEKVGEGDLIQLSFVPSDFAYHLILSIDGNKQISLHYPSQKSGEVTPMKESKKQQRFLNYSYELDNAPKFERFILFSSKKSFKVEQVVHLVKNFIKTTKDIERDPIKLPDDMKQYSILLEKR